MSVTPQTTDFYSRVMVELFNEKAVIGVPTGFQAFFGRPENESKTVFSPDANVVDIDIMRGNEKTAALIQRGSDGRNIDSPSSTNEQKFSSFSRVFPLGEETSDISADQLNKRLAGENPFSPSTKFDKVRFLAADMHMEHIRRFVRMFERLAAQSALTGKQDGIIGTTNSDLQYDFRRNSGNTITVGTAWNGVSPTIAADIDGGCVQFRKTAKMTPDMIIIGGDGMSSFIADPDLQTLADNRRFELLEVSTGNPVPPKFDKFVNAGFIPRGRLRTPEGFTLWIFTYVDIFTNDSDVSVNYMPKDEALIASSESRNDRYFGPSEMLPNDTTSRAFYRDFFGFDDVSAPMPDNIKGGTIVPQMFYFDAYMGVGRKTVTMRSQTGPIFATTQTDAFVLLDGLQT